MRLLELGLRLLVLGPVRSCAQGSRRGIFGQGLVNYLGSEEVEGGGMDRLVESQVGSEEVVRSDFDLVVVVRTPF
jgi:hypothetical protein